MFLPCSNVQGRIVMFETYFYYAKKNGLLQLIITPTKEVLFPWPFVHIFMFVCY